MVGCNSSQRLVVLRTAPPSLHCYHHCCVTSLLLRWRARPSVLRKHPVLHHPNHAPPRPPPSPLPQLLPSSSSVYVQTYIITRSSITDLSPAPSLQHSVLCHILSHSLPSPYHIASHHPPTLPRRFHSQTRHARIHTGELSSPLRAAPLVRQDTRLMQRTHAPPPVLCPHSQARSRTPARTPAARSASLGRTN